MLLIDSLESFVYSMNDDENYEKQVENDYNANMVFNDGELMVIRIRNYDAIQKFGSDYNIKQIYN